MPANSGELEAGTDADCHRRGQLDPAGTVARDWSVAGSRLRGTLFRQRDDQLPGAKVGSFCSDAARVRNQSAFDANRPKCRMVLDDRHVAALYGVVSGRVMVDSCPAIF